MNKRASHWKRNYPCLLEVMANSEQVDEDDIAEELARIASAKPVMTDDAALVSFINEHGYGGKA